MSLKSSQPRSSDLAALSKIRTDEGFAIAVTK